MHNKILIFIIELYIIYLGDNIELNSNDNYARKKAN